jgi:hypothetical protein
MGRSETTRLSLLISQRRSGLASSWDNPKVDLFEYAVYELRQSTLLDRVQLANVVERGPDRAMPRQLREYLGRMLRHEIPLATPRGRKRKSEAWLDFTFLEVDERYRRYRRRYEVQKRKLIAAGTPPVRGAPSPSELAYRQILRDMRRDFPNVDWKALRNRHSKWRQGKLPPLRFHPDEPPEF